MEEINNEVMEDNYTDDVEVTTDVEIIDDEETEHGGVPTGVLVAGGAALVAGATALVVKVGPKVIKKVKSGIANVKGKLGRKKDPDYTEVDSDGKGVSLKEIAEEEASKIQAEED